MAAMAGTLHPDVLRGEEVGEPQAMTLEYKPTANVALWTLPHDSRSAESGMFQAMRPTNFPPEDYLVPIKYRGRCVFQFYMALDENGHWSSETGLGMIDLTDPDAGGQLADIEQATWELQDYLGVGTETRTAIFLPSGLTFTVGRNGAREAAVYITFSNRGPGIGSFDKYLPETGQLFTPPELQKLLTP